MDIVGLSVTLGITGGVSLVAGWWSLHKLRKARYLLDTPTSKIRSAAQGYVELYGQLSEGLGELQAPLSAKPCVWWSYRIDREEKNDKGERKWRRVAARRSTSLLCLNDGTGECWIDPHGAEVITQTKVVWYGATAHPQRQPQRKKFLGLALRGNKSYRYIEHRLHLHDTLYAIGDFYSREITEKASPSPNLEVDRYRQLSEYAWQKAAQSEMQYFLGKPAAGRPYILSDFVEDKVAKRFTCKAILFAFVCLSSAIIGAYLINTHLY